MIVYVVTRQRIAVQTGNTDRIIANFILIHFDFAWSEYRAIDKIIILY